MSLGKHANDCKRSNSASRITKVSLGDRSGTILFALRCAARWLHPVEPKPGSSGTPGLRRKEIIVSLLSRHLPFSSQARLGTVPGYYQPSRWRGMDLDAATVWNPTLCKKRGLVGLETSGADSSGLTEAMRSFYAAWMFGSRNSRSLWGHRVRLEQFVSGRRCGDARSFLVRRAI